MTCKSCHETITTSWSFNTSFGMNHCHTSYCERTLTVNTDSANDCLEMSEEERGGEDHKFKCRYTVWQAAMAACSILFYSRQPHFIKMATGRLFKLLWKAEGWIDEDSWYHIKARTMACISVSTGIITEHSGDLKITALKPALVQPRSRSGEQIRSKDKLTWIDESQMTKAKFSFVFSLWNSEKKFCYSPSSEPWGHFFFVTCLFYGSPCLRSGVTACCPVNVTKVFTAQSSLLRTCLNDCDDVTSREKRLLIHLND